MRNRPSLPLFILIGLAVWQVIVQIPGSFVVTGDSWGLTDWLINYSGGFVRRGLAGTIAHWMYESFRVPTLPLIALTSFTSYFLLVGWFLRNTIRDVSATFILSSVVLGFPAYQSTIVRKDCLLLLLLIACCLCVRSLRIKPLPKWLIVNVTCCLGILLHETFAFFAMPGLILLHPNQSLRSIGFRCLAILPTAVCLALTVANHGTPEIAKSIHDSWAPLWQSAIHDATLQNTPFATILSIGWTSSEGMLQTKGILQQGLYQPLAWLGVCTVTFLLAARFLIAEQSEGCFGRWIAILAFQFLCISPLFLLGVDYGRWIFFWMGSSIIFFSTGHVFPQSLANHAIAHALINTTRRLVGFIPQSEWLLLLFGLPVLWSIRNFLTASPVGRLIQQIDPRAF